MSIQGGRRSAAAVIAVIIVAALGVGWLYHRSDSKPPAPRILVSPGGGLNAFDAIPADTVWTYGMQMMADIDKHPITITRLSVVDPTPGFHIVRFAVARNRKTNMVSERGFPTRDAPHPTSPIGIVLQPEKPKTAQGVELLVAFQVASGARLQGFRGLRIDYEYQGHPHHYIVASAYTVCARHGSATEVNQVSACAPQLQPVSAHSTNQ